MPERVDREILKRNGNQEIIHTVFLGLIHITDISFPRNRKGSFKPLKRLWRSTMGVQSLSILATLYVHLYFCFQNGQVTERSIYAFPWDSTVEE